MANIEYIGEIGNLSTNTDIPRKPIQLLVSADI